MLDRDQAIKKLLSTAADALGEQYDRAFISEFRHQLNDPQFENKKTPQDWQAYVPTEIKEFWHYLDEIARIAVWFSSHRQITEEDT